MRVISGSLRGLKLSCPEGLKTRPTLDRVKEALFSMLFDKTADASVLDLFAGSGALGIEALSRYAAHCTFVDKDKEALSVIKSNIQKCRLCDRADIIESDSINFLEKTSGCYDIIFLDPPYGAGLYEQVLKIIKARGLLKDNGVVIAECDSSYEIAPVGFCIVKNKTYGKVKLYVLEDSEHNEIDSSLSGQL